ncbi:MAG: hypothetical protein PHU91_04110 [Candidatus Omnitrophica bacterium]|nr:hypothetical protein [Candidatus Omnitrophota bacterium]MDD5236825.1 hypothetical protein [Candidatus Omnitrophota bacterium]MDD5611173.1 hypothetical protein [Candidatus Omnitrophota bacterium]
MGKRSKRKAFGPKKKALCDFHACRKKKAGSHKTPSASGGIKHSRVDLRNI